MFLEELLTESEAVAEAHMAGKLTPSVMKKALMNMEKYEFMRDTLDDVEETIMRTNSKSKGDKPVKRSKSTMSEDKEEKPAGRGGRKKNKMVEELEEEQA